MDENCYMSITYREQYYVPLQLVKCRNVAITIDFRIGRESALSVLAIVPAQLR